MTQWIRYSLITASMLFALLGAQMAQGATLPNVNTVDIPVLTQQVREGTVITPAMLTTRDMLANRLPSTAILQKDNIIGMEATRTISGNRPIYPNQVRIPPEVRRGSRVIIHYNDAGIALSVDGEALEDGNTGDTIRVTGATGSIINALITENGRLVVQ